jgi:lipopolysaccharide export system protein LptA
MSRLLAFPLFASALVLAVAVPAHAEKADRLKPAVIQADANGVGQIDLQKQVAVVSGNVVVTKGTMVIHAARVELSKTPGGYDTATAFGAVGKPATFRQKREGVDEYMEGEADRIEYDGKTDVVRFVTNAAVRRLRGAALADEMNGNLITYDGTSEVMSAAGGASTTTNPGGRVRIVLTPREGSEAAAEAASAAGPLKMTPALPATGIGDKR